VRVNGGTWQTVSGTGNWTTTVNLAQGSNKIEAQSQDNAGNSSTITSVTLTQSPHVTMDFNKDGFPDLLFEDASGTIAYWSLNGVERVGGSLFDESPGTSDWQLVGCGDFDGDHQLDLVFQDSSGALVTWLMNGTSLKRATPFGADMRYWWTPGWRVVAVRDIDGDGKPDLIFQHEKGFLAAWLLDGTNVVSTTALTPDFPGVGWKAFGAGDFYGDGKWELALQHDDGSLGIWDMDRASLVTPHFLTPQWPSPGWRGVGVADLDGDGKSDLLLQHEPTKALGVWFMSGHVMLRSATLDPEWALGTWELVGPR
jgi:hypothetical protein